MDIPNGYKRQDIVNQDNVCDGCAFSKTGDPQCYHPSYDIKKCNTRERYIYVKIPLAEILKNL